MDLIRELMLRPEALDKSPTAVIRLGGIYEGGWMDRGTRDAARAVAAEVGMASERCWHQPRHR
jgi:hypothetical protein